MPCVGRTAPHVSTGRYYTAARTCHIKCVQAGAPHRVRGSCTSLFTSFSAPSNMMAPHSARPANTSACVRNSVRLWAGGEGSRSHSRTLFRAAVGGRRGEPQSQSHTVPQLHHTVIHTPAFTLYQMCTKNRIHRAGVCVCARVRVCVCVVCMCACARRGFCAGCSASDVLFLALGLSAPSLASAI